MPEEPYYQINSSDNESDEDTSIPLAVGEDEYHSTSGADQTAVDLAGMLAADGSTITVTEMSEGEYHGDE